MGASSPSWPPSAPPPDERGDARRQGVRLNARLRFRLSLFQPADDESSAPAGGEDYLPELIGRTRNLSETGLALALPDIHLGEQDLSASGSTLQLTLDLPYGPVAIRATPVRCEPLGAETKGYLLGVRIIEMDDKEWVRYVQFLRSFC